MVKSLKEKEVIILFKKLNESFKEKINKTLIGFLFFLYFLVLIWTIIFHLSGYTGLDTYYLALEKGYSISYRFGINRIYEYEVLSPRFWGDNFINIFLFMPMGALVMFDCFENKSFLKILILSFFVSATFEISQVFTRLGSFSYIDTIFNCLGALIGLLLFKLLKKKCNFLVINYSALILTVIFIPVLIFAITSLCFKWNMFSVFFDFEKYPYIW